MSEVTEVYYQPISSYLAEPFARPRSSTGLAGYITEAEQAEKHDISLATLRRWRQQRYGPQAVQIGRRFYYREDATERWLAEQEAAAKASAEPRRGRPRWAGR